MSYTIDEQNAERQQLLAEVLNPVAIEILKRIGRNPEWRCLDLGCGQGNTTRMLAEQLNPAACVGLDYDAKLVAYARDHPGNRPGVSYEQGSAMALTYGDESFDVVFVRYLLVHLPDPDQAIREIRRVLKPGGKAIVYEPDFSQEHAEPASWGMPKMTEVWHGMFAQPYIGRLIPGKFRRAGMQVEVGTHLMVETEPGPLRRVYRMTLESLKAGLLERGIHTREEYDEHLEEMKRLENDPESLITKFPDYWIIATK